MDAINIFCDLSEAFDYVDHLKEQLLGICQFFSVTAALEQVSYTYAFLYEFLMIDLIKRLIFE